MARGFVYLTVPTLNGLSVDTSHVVGLFFAIRQREILELVENGHLISLFAGLERGEKSAAIAYTLIETAKLNAVNPQAWLTDVLSRIGGHKANRIDELLPWRYSQKS